MSLTTELEKLVEEKLASGHYTSASKIVHEGLRLLAERDELRETKLKALREAIAKGVASARAGRLVDGEEAVTKILEEDL